MKHKTKREKHVHRIARQNLTAWCKLVLKLALTEKSATITHVVD
jgi:hypothetical protein